MKHGSCIMDHKSNLFWNSCMCRCEGNNNYSWNYMYSNTSVLLLETCFILKQLSCLFLHLKLTKHNEWVWTSHESVAWGTLCTVCVNLWHCSLTMFRGTRIKFLSLLQCYEDFSFYWKSLGNSGQCSERLRNLQS